jgi:ParB-like chromosome segregation protein Spo0J
MGEEEIAAAFFVSVVVVKQRLRLAAVSPALLDVYAEDGITLDQLMAFTVNPDHQRQEQVWEALQRHYSKQPYEIRRMLTEGAVRASDKRAQFIGIDAYVEAGGEVLNDLFQSDDGGWLQDAGLARHARAEKLREAADEVAAEGFKWVETVRRPALCPPLRPAPALWRAGPAEPRAGGRARRASGRGRADRGRVRRSRGVLGRGGPAHGRDRDGAGGAGEPALGVRPAEVRDRGRVRQPRKRWAASD